MLDFLFYLRLSNVICAARHFLRSVLSSAVGGEADVVVMEAQTAFSGARFWQEFVFLLPIYKGASYKPFPQGSQYLLLLIVCYIQFSLKKRLYSMLCMTEFLNCSLENVALFRLHGDISTVIAVSAESPNQRVKALRQSHRAKTRWQKPGVALPHTPSPWRLVFVAKAEPKASFRPFCCLFPHLCLLRVSSHQV